MHQVKMEPRDRREIRAKQGLREILDSQDKQEVLGPPAQPGQLGRLGLREALVQWEP